MREAKTFLHLIKMCNGAYLAPLGPTTILTILPGRGGLLQFFAGQGEHLWSEFCKNTNNQCTLSTTAIHSVRAVVAQITIWTLGNFVETRESQTFERSSTLLPRFSVFTHVLDFGFSWNSKLENNCNLEGYQEVFLLLQIYIYTNYTKYTGCFFTGTSLKS